MGKKSDGDKAGISTGTTKIMPIGSKPTEMGSKGKNQKPASGGTQSVSRGQKIKC